MVYDIASENSFQCMKRWVNELKQAEPEDVVLAVAGNKCDLEKQRQVSHPLAIFKFYSEVIESYQWCFEGGLIGRSPP